MTAACVAATWQSTIDLAGTAIDPTTPPKHPNLCIATIEQPRRKRSSDHRHLKLNHHPAHPSDFPALQAGKSIRWPDIGWVAVGAFGAFAPRI